MGEMKIFHFDERSKYFIKLVENSKVMDVMKMTSKIPKATLVYGFYTASQKDSVVMLEIISKKLSDEEIRLAIKLSIEHAIIKPSKSVMDFFIKNLKHQSLANPSPPPSLFKSLIEKRLAFTQKAHQKEFSNLLIEHENYQSSVNIINQVAQDKDLTYFKSKLGM